jgi:imidazole glycerol-phosphate synthase subunit HisF
MLTKRLIGTVIIKDDLAVQSFGYNKYLPIGKPEYIIENLDRWGADEIVIFNIDRTLNKNGPNFKLIERLKKINLKTPLSYGGGIQSLQDGIKLITMGVERLVIDNLLHSSISVIRDLAKTVGRQAIIGCLPLSFENNQLMWLDHLTKQKKNLFNQNIINSLDEIFSEIIIVDWKNEGSFGKFNIKLIMPFQNQINISLIPFGGVNDIKKIETLYSLSFISAIAIGNSLNYKEHSIQNIKNKVGLSFLRPPFYQNTDME